MRSACLLFFVGAVLLPNRTFQAPPGPDSTEPKRGFRLFGKDVVLDHEQIVVEPTDSSSPARPVTEISNNPRIWQGIPFDRPWQELPLNHPWRNLPFNHPWQCHGPIGIVRPHCDQASSSLRHSHDEQGPSNALRPPAENSLSAKQQSSPSPMMLSSSSSSQGSPDSAPGSSTFMRDARRAARSPPLEQQEETIENRGSEKLSKGWINRREDEAARYAKHGIETSGKGLPLLQTDVSKWNLEKYGGSETIKLFQEASNGKWGTMRVGMKTRTDAGKYQVPLPDPAWPKNWRSFFNHHTMSHLKEVVATQWPGLESLKDFDFSMRGKKNTVLLSAQLGQDRWLSTIPLYNCEDRNQKLEQLFRMNPQAKVHLSDMTRKKNSALQAANQPHVAPLLVIKVIISDRFIPPDPNFGVKVYRTLDEVYSGDLDENFTHEGFSFPVTWSPDEDRGEKRRQTERFKEQLASVGKYDEQDFKKLLGAVQRQRARLRRRESHQGTAKDMSEADGGAS